MEAERATGPSRLTRRTGGPSRLTPGTVAEERSRKRVRDGDACNDDDDAMSRACSDSDLCAICLTDLDPEGGEAGATMTTLSCRHRFHTSCIDHWLGHQALCPCCRALARTPCTVRVRGVELAVPWSSNDTCGTMIAKAVNVFSERFPIFTFRFPMPDEFCCSVRGYSSSIANIDMSTDTSIADLMSGSSSEGLPPKLDVPDVPTHAATIHDFAFARLLLPRPDRPDWASPASSDPYYCRRPRWKEDALTEHQHGQCGWSRARRVLELEQQLLCLERDDDEEALADDDAWRPRRRLHVALRQVCVSMCREGQEEDAACSCADPPPHARARSPLASAQA